MPAAAVFSPSALKSASRECAAANYPKGYPVPLRDVMIVVLLVLDDLAALPARLSPLERDKVGRSGRIRSRSEQSRIVVIVVVAVVVVGVVGDESRDGVLSRASAKIVTFLEYQDGTRSGCSFFSPKAERMEKDRSTLRRCIVHYSIIIDCSSGGRACDLPIIADRSVT